MRYLLLLFFISLTSQLSAQSKENICLFGKDNGGHCGFYKDAKLSDPVDLDGSSLILNSENKYAYKDYSSEAFNKFYITMNAADDEEVRLFYDVEFQLLDENDEVVFSQFTGGPPPGGSYDQDIFRNEGVKLRIYYAGSATKNLRFTKVREVVEP